MTVSLSCASQEGPQGFWAQSLYYPWSKEFMEAGKRRLAGDTSRAATPDEVKDLRRESRDLKKCVADLTLEKPAAKKKHAGGWGRPRMRYPATEKLEIIKLVEQSHLAAKRKMDSSASRGGPSTSGMTDTAMAGRRVLPIGRRRRAGCGTVSRPGSRTRSSSWCWSSPN